MSDQNSFMYREFTTEDLTRGYTCIEVLPNHLSCKRHADYFIVTSDEQFGEMSNPYCAQHFTLRLSAFKQAHVEDQIEPVNLSLQETEMKEEAEARNQIKGNKQ